MAKVTIADVAALAGVSTATVSRVLNNKGKVDEAIRLKVLSAVDQLEYRPRRRSSAGGSHAGSIVVQIGLQRDPGADWYFGRIVQGIESVLREANRTLLLSTDEAMVGDPASVIDLARQGRIDGMIIGGGALDHEQLTLVRSIECPVVLVDRYLEGDVASVIVDNVGCAREAVVHLIETGFSTVAMVNGPDHIPACQDKLSGYRLALEESGISFDPDLVIWDEDYHTWQGGYRAARQLFERFKPPVGIFAFDDLMAHGVIKAAEELGLAVPRDVAVVGFGDLLYERTGIALTSVRINYEHYGRLLAQLLLDLIEEKVTVPVQIAIRGHLVVRDSSHTQ